MLYNIRKSELFVQFQLIICHVPVNVNPTKFIGIIRCERNHWIAIELSRILNIFGYYHIVDIKILIPIVPKYTIVIFSILEKWSYSINWYDNSQSLYHVKLCCEIKSYQQSIITYESSKCCIQVHIWKVPQTNCEQVTSYGIKNGKNEDRPQFAWQILNLMIKKINNNKMNIFLGHW